jgi:hypothetical protein
MRTYGKRDPVTHRTPEQTRELDRTYNARPEMVHRRVLNNQARQLLMNEGAVRKGDDKDVDHIKMLDKGGSNVRSNLRAISRSRNRGWRDGV